MYENAAYYGSTSAPQAHLLMSPASTSMTPYVRLFRQTRSSRDGKLAQLSLRGRRQLEQLDRLRRRRRKVQSEITEVTGKIAAQRLVRTSAKEAARRDPADDKLRRKYLRENAELNALQSTLVNETEHLERVRAAIRRKRADVKDTARKIRSRMAHLEASDGQAVAAAAEADKAVAHAVEIQTEAAESASHEERAEILRQFKALQDALLQLQELQAQVGSANAKLVAKGAEATDADRQAVASLQSQMVSQGMTVLGLFMAMSMIDISPLAAAPSPEEDEVDGSFGLVPNWAYDYDLTGAEFGGVDDGYFGFNLGGGQPGGYSAQLWSQNAAPSGGQQQTPPQQQPQQGGGSQQDAMGWVNAIGGAAGGFMQGLGAMIGAIGQNQAMTQQQHQQWQNTQQGLYNAGAALQGQQPPGANYGPQVQQQYPPPPAPTPQKNWMPWAFGGVAVLGLGALTWAILSS